MTSPDERLKLVFCGTPQFAVPTLEALIAAGHDVALVVSQPDRPVGRAQTLTAPPVKQAALAHGIEVVQPEKIRNNPEFQARLEAIQPDAIIVVAYGRILPPWMLKLPRMGCLNLHASLLPRYRGAAPIQWAIANGEAFTGLCIMLLDEGLDTGPVALQQRRIIGSRETAIDLFEHLATAGAILMVKALPLISHGWHRPWFQKHGLATQAPLLTREDGRMDFAARNARQLFDRWRGFQPWPGAFTALGGKKLIVHTMSVVVDADSAHFPLKEPGSIHIEGPRIFAACAANTWLEFLEVQLEGKKRVTAAEFLRGATIAAGARLG